MSDKTEEKIEDLAEKIVEGLEITLNQFGDVLPEQVDGLTPKQQRRALKAVIGYLHKKDPNVDLKALTEREQKFLGGLFNLAEAAVQYSIYALGEAQKEYDEKQAAKEASNE